MANNSSDTINISREAMLKGRNRVPAYSLGFSADVAGLSDKGKVRTNNEDHFLVCRYGRFLQAMDSNLPSDDLPNHEEEIGYAMAVADGMGGHAAGEVASRLALNTFVNLALATPDWILRFEEADMIPAAMNRAMDRIAHVKAVLAREAQQDPWLRGFGTTLAMAWGVGKKLFVLHVGDSRVYLLRDGHLRQLTQDHTVAQDMANTGFLKQHQVATHYFRHHLSQCLNDNGKPVQPDVQKLMLSDGDVIMLCSDGLSDTVPDEEIAAVLNTTPTSKSACSELLEKALSYGGKDNVTVIVARYQLAGSE